MLGALKALAEMPLETDRFLYWHHTSQSSAPMSPTSSDLTSLLFLPRYFEDPSLCSLEIEGEQVAFLWMVPITERERQYAIEKGSETLDMVLAEEPLGVIVSERRRSLV